MKRTRLITSCLLALVVAAGIAAASETPQRRPAQSSIKERLSVVESKAAKLAANSSRWSAQMDKILAQLDATLAKVRDMRKNIEGK